MAILTRAQRREERAKKRHLQKYRERLQQEQARAQRFLEGLEQAMVDLGLPETLAVEGERRLKTHATLLGKIVGLMFPSVFGCRTSYELTRMRVWDKNLPSQRLGALPKQKWVRQLPTPGMGSSGHPGAPWGGQEPRDPQSLAMDLGG
jgi:hypothetical protein